jgi:flagellar assembly protein FliH
MRIKLLSKIIKPGDKRLFDSAKKFEKKLLAANSRPFRTQVKEQSSPNPSPESGGDPYPRLETQHVSPQDLIVEAEWKAETTLQEATRKVEQLLSGTACETERLTREAGCEAERLVREARSEAEQALREARSEVDQIREKAREEGYSEGFTRAVEEGERKTDEQLRASFQALDSLVSQIKTQESEMKRRLTPVIANLATQMAQKIIGREIEKDSSMVLTQAEEAIGKILERDKLIIRVNPADEELMKPHKAPLMKMFDGIDKIDVIADRDVERGGCIVETNHIRVDAQPSSQLEAARKKLLSEAAK